MLLLLIEAVLLASSGRVHAQFTFTTNDGSLTITGYTGTNGTVVIPVKTNGYPVTSIGDDAFHFCTSLTSVTIPNSVTSLGSYAFEDCINLTSIMIPNSITNIGFNSFYGCNNLTSLTIASSTIGSAWFLGLPLTSVTILNSVTNIGKYAFSRCTGLFSVTISNSVTTIEIGAFSLCTSLTSVTIPNSVTSIRDSAFEYCTSLTNVIIGSGVTNIKYEAFSECSQLSHIIFTSNAPSLGSPVFNGDNSATVYYLPGTTGWSSTFGGLPTLLWNPQMQTGDGSFGVQSNGFGFSITGTPGISLVVETSTNVASGIWQPLQTNTLTNGSVYFSDPQSTNYPGRFYRLRSP